MGPHAIGQSVRRSEDPRLLRGQGRYTADLSIQGQAHAVFLRSRHAHGVLRGIDADAARALPGVLGIFTQDDLAAAGIKPMAPMQVGKNRDGSAMVVPVQTVLASDKLRYVGHPIAIIVAETVAQARDAADAILVEIDTLPAVTEPEAALKPGAPLVYDEVAGNLVLDYQHGDAEAAEAAFAGAAHVTTLSLRNTRLVVASLEPRGAVAEYDAAAEHFTLHLGCQSVFGQRNGIAALLGIDKTKLRVLSQQIGGSFGMKASVYPEYAATLHAARALGRAVKWVDDRSESFLSDSHGRDHAMTVSLALAADGTFLALRVRGVGNLGACLSNAVTLPATVNTVKNIIGVYRTPVLDVQTRLVFTNTTPVGAYRGAGRPEGNYYMERLVSTAAREMGIDQVELRRRNHIRPDMIPYAAPSAQTYDSGDFPAILTEAVARADLPGYPARRAASQARGRLRGLGLAQYLEATAPASQEMGGIRFEPDGDVTIITGTLDYGQGHAAAFAQVLVSQLGVPFERIRLVQGDSDQLLAGGGTGGSRSIMASGSAIVAASKEVITRGKALAAHLLEAAAADIEFADGRFAIAGTDRAIGLLELAARARTAPGLPEGVPSSLDVGLVEKSPTSAFPNGCHVVEVEIDPDTGEIRLDRYETVSDFGNLVNPMLVRGQLHGGIMQGFGQAVLENVRYDEAGQLITGSFMDYAMPRAEHGTEFGFASHPVPATTNVLGVKGAGEAGCAGSIPAIMNAIVDALAACGVTELDMPATPERVWRAIHHA